MKKIANLGHPAALFACTILGFIAALIVGSITNDTAMATIVFLFVDVVAFLEVEHYFREKDHVETYEEFINARL